MDNMSKKLKTFEILCGDWDYRNIDMTEPHLQNIEIIDDDILISCELFLPEIDDYVSCEGGIISDKSMIKRFNDLDLMNREKVLGFILEIENHIDWDKVNKTLSDEILKEKENIKLDDFDDIQEKIVPAKKLGEGWNWHKYDDGSGHLESPDGKEYMLYDLCTNEYQETINSSYDFFPLNYYYADGVDPDKFKPFEYMEDEMIKYISKENEGLSI